MLVLDIKLLWPDGRCPPGLLLGQQADVAQSLR